MLMELSIRMASPSGLSLCPKQTLGTSSTPNHSNPRCCNMPSIIGEEAITSAPTNQYWVLLGPVGSRDTRTSSQRVVQVPSVLPRVVTIPEDEDNCTTIILLEQIIEKNIQKLFMNYKVLCATPFRVMRNADLTIDEDEAADLLIEIEKQLKKRQWGEAIRLEVEDNIDKRLLKTLRRELRIAEDSIFKINGPSI